MSGGLSGVRVIDAGTNIAGPYAASILSDLGADVVKVEPIAGDPLRALPPFVEGIGSVFASANHGKRYLSLDLRQVPGREVVQRLIRESDVLIQNLRPGREIPLGLDARSSHQENPRLVHASVEAFYPIDSQRPGYDLLIQAESGLIDLNGEAGRAPARIPAAMIDHVTGTWLAMGIVAALAGQRQKATIRISMLDVALGLLNERASVFLATGVEPQRMGSATANTTPHGAFPTADAYIVIGAATDASFARLADVLGPPLADNPLYQSQEGRLGNREELEQAITAALSTYGADHWIDALTRADVPVARVSRLSEAVARHIEHSPTGLRAQAVPTSNQVLALPIRLDGETSEDPLPPPRGVGGDSTAVLTELGYTDEQTNALIADSVLRA